MNGAPSRLSRVLCWLLAAVLAAIFIYAGQVKIIKPAEFVSDLRNYRMFPWWSLNGMALMLPSWEVLAGVALLLPRWRRAGALATLLFGIAFFTSVSIAMARGLDISCGCFGHGDRAAHAGLKTLALDLFIILSSTFILRQTGRASEAGDPAEYDFPFGCEAR